MTLNELLAMDRQIIAVDKCAWRDQNEIISERSPCYYHGRDCGPKCVEYIPIKVLREYMEDNDGRL